jgi:hypothetical protein
VCNFAILWSALLGSLLKAACVIPRTSCAPSRRRTTGIPLMGCGPDKNFSRFSSFSRVLFYAIQKKGDYITFFSRANMIR